MNTVRYHAFLLVLVLASACAGSPARQSSPPLVDKAHAGGPTAALDSQSTEQRSSDRPEIPGLRLPTDVAPTRYALELIIDPAEASFDGVMQIDVEVRRPTQTLWLHARDLTVMSAELSVQGRNVGLEPIAEDNPDIIGFKVAEPLTEGRARVRIAYRAKFYMPHDGGIFHVPIRDRWYTYSHFEPLDARRAFPCFDEPSYKVPWQITLEVRSEQLAFSNTPLVASRPGERDGFTRYEFAESKPLPSYLISVAVGPFDVVDIGRIGRGQVPARIIVPNGRADDAAYAKQSIPKLLTWFEDYFDMAYPFAKLDSVAVPGQGGAMEHPGLVTYGEHILLTDSRSMSSRFESFHTMVVAHELAHQWFGNLVTLAWWNDLWLNESFATWMASKARSAIAPEWQSDLEELVQLELTKSVDARASARSLRRRIDNNQDIEATFDSISYGKGGAVLSMFEQWVGEEAFRRGVRAYLRDHAWRTATAEDFLAALARASDPDIADAFQTFLEQPGLPRVSVELSCEEESPASVILRQTPFAGSSPAAGADARVWDIPVCVRYGQKSFEHQQCVLMKGTLATMVLQQSQGCPKHFLANARGAGYYRVAYSKPLRDALATASLDLMSPLEQLSTINDLHALVEEGGIGVGEILALLPSLAADRAPHVAAKAAALASSIRPSWVPESLRDQHARFILALFGKRARSLGWLPRSGESPIVLDLRRRVVQLVADVGRDRSLRRKAKKLALEWLAKRPVMERDTLAAILAVALLDVDEATYRRFEEAVDTVEDHNQRFALLFALAETAKLHQLEKHWQKFLEHGYDWRAAWFFLRIPLGRPDTQDATFEFLTQNFDQLAKPLPEQWRAALIASFGVLCDDARYRDVKNFLATKAGAIENGERTMAQTLDTIERCVTARGAQQPQIESFLRTWKPRPSGP